MPKVAQEVPEAVDPAPLSDSRTERLNAIQKQIDELCKQREAVMQEDV